ncbi:MAG: c-type cytochrome [Ignavibacteria bacterium]|nr:c-type cytochrome [Ignavibacteria bacterium]
MQKKIYQFFLLTITSCFIVSCNTSEKPASIHSIYKTSSDSIQTAVYDTSAISEGPEKVAILYGRELFMNTHKLIGPKGTVLQQTGNEVDCRNCHINGGTKPFGMPLFTSVARYPQYRARESNILTIQDRVNNCIERPLLGKAIPFNSKEMNAFAMYLKWLWDCNKNAMKIEGDIPNRIPWMNRRADWQKGKADYAQLCARCHGIDGQGVKAPGGYGYTYPPVWGEHAYSIGSSMHRVGKLAAFIRNNMPNDMDITKIHVTEEQAYDIAAYLNNEQVNPRPDFHEDDILYPNHADKSVDYPIGPYADTFSQDQHKYGPFKPIDDYWKARRKK